MAIAFVYCWTDHKTNKLYVGSHKGTTDDGYICSSKYMIEEYNKRPEDFTRQIIAHGSEKDIRDLESKILQTVNAKMNESFYNLHNGNGDFYISGPFTETHKRKISENHARLKGKDNPFFGKKHTEETKNKIGISSKLRNQNENNPNYNNKWSEEQRKAQSERLLGNGKNIKKSDEHKKKMSEAAKRRWNKIKGIQNGGE